MLDALCRQDGWHMRMQQLARATALSSSATTRLVNRLEDRGLLTRILCADDRRGIYTELTPSGVALLEQARPTHDATLERALEQAQQVPELAPLVDALEAPRRGLGRGASCLMRLGGDGLFGRRVLEVVLQVFQALVRTSGCTSRRT